MIFSVVGPTALPKIIITSPNCCHHRLKGRRSIFEIKVMYNTIPLLFTKASLEKSWNFLGIN